MGPGGGVGTQPSGPTWVLLGYFGPMVVDGSPVIVLVLPTAFSPPFDENTGTQDNRGILLPASSDAVTSHETLKFHPAVTPPQVTITRQLWQGPYPLQSPNSDDGIRKRGLSVRRDGPECPPIKWNAEV